MRGWCLSVGGLALACTSALGGCTMDGRRTPSSGVLPGDGAAQAATAPAPPTGLTPAQQAEIDAAVEAYREANLAKQAAPPADTPPPAPDAPADPGSNPEPNAETVAAADPISWLDPGGTGARAVAPVESREPPAAPPVEEAEPVETASQPAVAESAAPRTVPDLQPPADAVTGPGLVTITALELCRSVSGFGAFEPFEDTTFTAGAPVRMVLYTEIDGFGTDAEPIAGAAEGPNALLHRVRLEQEVLLFRDADGLVVWSRPPEKIQDESRRVRRDFWSVQLVELPANLGVGRYRLKVRITDEVSGSVDERSVPLRLVAEAP